MKDNNIKKHYWIYPTRACNLNCHYCYQRETNRDPGNSKLYMPRKIAAEVIDFIIRDEPAREKQIQFFGGEPLLAWDIIEFFVERLKSLASFSITTNGTLLDRERLTFLKDHNFGLALSIDGPPGVTRKSRPGSESMPVDLVAEFFPRAQIIMTLSPENIEDAYESTLWFIKKGFVNIAHNLAIEKPWARHCVKSHNLAFEKLADLYIQSRKMTNKSITNSAMNTFSFMFIAYAEKAVHNSTYHGEKNVCGSNTNLISIDINGDIYPCQDMVTCDREKNYMLGNIRNGYIPPGSIPLSAMKFPDREACYLCWFYHQCVGGCGPKNLLVCGDRFKPIMNGCGLYAKQIQEGFRALLNTGQLRTEKKNGN